MWLSRGLVFNSFTRFLAWNCRYIVYGNPGLSSVSMYWPHASTDESSGQVATAFLSMIRAISSLNRVGVASDIRLLISICERCSWQSLCIISDVWNQWHSRCGKCGCSRNSCWSSRIWGAVDGVMTSGVFGPNDNTSTDPPKQVGVVGFWGPSFRTDCQCARPHMLS